MFKNSGLIGLILLSPGFAAAEQGACGQGWDLVESCRTLSEPSEVPTPFFLKEIKKEKMEAKVTNENSGQQENAEQQQIDEALIPKNSGYVPIPKSFVDLCWNKSKKQQKVLIRIPSLEFKHEFPELHGYNLEMSRGMYYEIAGSVAILIPYKGTTFGKFGAIWRLEGDKQIENSAKLDCSFPSNPEEFEKIIMESK